jgi:hypothetical protein
MKNRFQNLPFKFNLQRYIGGAEGVVEGVRHLNATAVGLCTSNQVDP